MHRCQMLIKIVCERDWGGGGGEGGGLQQREKNPIFCLSWELISCLCLLISFIKIVFVSFLEISPPPPPPPSPFSLSLSLSLSHQPVRPHPALNVACVCCAECSRYPCSSLAPTVFIADTPSLSHYSAALPCMKRGRETGLAVCQGYWLAGEQCIASGGYVGWCNERKKGRGGVGEEDAMETIVKEKNIKKKERRGLWCRWACVCKKERKKKGGGGIKKKRTEKLYVYCPSDLEFAQWSTGP